MQVIKTAKNKDWRYIEIYNPEYPAWNDMFRMFSEATEEEIKKEIFRRYGEYLPWRFPEEKADWKTRYEELDKKHTELVELLCNQCFDKYRMIA